MKILIIRDKTRSYNGGIKRHCEELSLLVNHYRDIEVLPIKDYPTKYIKLIRKSIYDLTQLQQSIIDSNCDVVHVHGFMSIGVIQAINIAYSLKRKIVYSPHFHPFKYLQNPLIGRIFFKCCIQPILYKINTIVTINSEDTHFFNKYHHNVVRIPHWNSSSNNAKGKNLFPKRKNTILFVGRNEENKGLEHLYQLPTQYEVHCVTKGPLLRKDFILHEAIDDQELDKLYDMASVVVIPSRYEAFSLVALEALSHHTPIVISDRVRIGDYLKGNKGYKIFEYHNFLSFNKAIEEIMVQQDVDYQELLKPFDIERIRNEYYKVYTIYK